MNSIDYIMIENKDYFGLWKKYRDLIAKFYNKLAMHKIYAFEDFDDFSAACYEVLVEAANAIKLEKIKNKETWTFYIQFYHYLQNYTTRKVIKEYYSDENTLSFEETFEGSYEDDNSVFEKKETLKNVIPKLSEHDKILLNKYIESGGKHSQARDAVLNKIRSM